MKSIAVLLIGCVVSLSATSDVATAVAWRWPIHCYFDQGSDQLTERCRQIVLETARSWRREQEGRQPKSDAIDPKDPYAPPYLAHARISGYAPDVTGSVRADHLSVRRAAAVAAELEREGVPSDLVTVIGLGNERPVVADDPTDPQNRLVKIELH